MIRFVVKAGRIEFSHLDVIESVLEIRNKEEVPEYMRQIEDWAVNFKKEDQFNLIREDVYVFVNRWAEVIELENA